MNREIYLKKEQAKMNADTKKRKQMSRIIKHAYEYYNPWLYPYEIKN